MAGENSLLCLGRRQIKRTIASTYGLSVVRDVLFQTVNHIIIEC